MPTLGAGHTMREYVLILAAFLPWQSLSRDSGCSSSLDCWLNGDCIDGFCVCDAAWDGERCETLAERSSYQLWPDPLVPPPGNVSQLASSWGATVLYSAADGQWHAFFDVVCANWTWMHVQAAVIIHATASEIEGPYSFHDVALPKQSVNPHLVQAPDGTYLLAHRRRRESTAYPSCTGDYASLDRFAFGEEVGGSLDDSACDGTNGASFSLAYSQNLSGPWTCHDVTIPVNGSSSNPNPSLLFVNGGPSVMLAYTVVTPADPVDSDTTSSFVSIATAPSWNSSVYLPFGQQYVSPQAGEDPFLWRSKRGFHVVFHKFGPPLVGGYAVSLDGKSWQAHPTAIYNLTVSWGDAGSTDFARRERPEMLFNSDGSIRGLLTGCELYEEDGHSSLSVFTAVRQAA